MVTVKRIERRKRGTARAAGPATEQALDATVRPGRL